MPCRSATCSPTSRWPCSARRPRCPSPRRSPSSSPAAWRFARRSTIAPPTSASCSSGWGGGPPRVENGLWAVAAAVLTLAVPGSLEHLREELASIIHDHLLRLSAVPRVEFGEPFYFQQSHIVEVSLGEGANTL